MCYEIIEFEPSLPAATLQLDHIRRVLKQERAESAGARGFFGNAETHLMGLPNIYFFARCTKDPAYLDTPTSGYWLTSPRSWAAG